MRRLGTRKTKTRIAGHQDCGECHPKVKNGKAKSRQDARREALLAMIMDKAEMRLLSSLCEATPDAPRRGR